MRRRTLLALTCGCVLTACARAPRSERAVEPESTPVETTERLWIDVREPGPFAAGHHPGAINIQWTWAQLAARIEAYAPDRATPLAVRASSPAEERKAIDLLDTKGYADVIVAPRGEDEGETLPLMTAEELRERLAGADPPVVIDVRSREEHEAGAIPGALLWLEDDPPARILDLDPSAEYAVICEGGWRSSQAASLMWRRGFRRVANVIDGMAAWRELR